MTSLADFPTKQKQNVSIIMLDAGEPGSIHSLPAYKLFIAFSFFFFKFFSIFFFANSQKIFICRHIVLHYHGFFQLTVIIGKADW